jgi:uncharacterized membrane protein YeaQ/YmgE (transglycosylase-associated protein family)
MDMSGESLLVIIVVGIIAGWLAGLIVQGGGMGILFDLLVGIVGAFIGNWLFAHFHLHLGVGLVGAIVHATVGAVILLFVLRLLTGFGRGPGYGRRL